MRTHTRVTGDRHGQCHRSRLVTTTHTRGWVWVVVEWIRKARERSGCDTATDRETDDPTRDRRRDARRDETRRDETRRVDDRTTRGRRVPRRWSRLVSSIRFDSNSIQIRFVTARPTATDSDDGPPPPPPRAGDDGRRSMSRTREVPNRGRRIESNERTNDRARVDVSLAPGRDDAMRWQGRPSRPVGASRGCAFFTRARAHTHASSPGFRRGARAPLRNPGLDACVCARARVKNAQPREAPTGRDGRPCHRIASSRPGARETSTRARSFVRSFDSIRRPRFGTSLVRDIDRRPSSPARGGGGGGPSSESVAVGRAVTNRI